MKAFHEIGFVRSVKYLIGLFQYTVLRIPILPPQLRVVLLRCFGARIGKNSNVLNVRFINIDRKGFKALQCGEDCFIGDETYLDLADDIIIENSVTIAEHVFILTHTNVGFKDHPLQKHFPPFTASVRIRKGSFIGINTSILPGVQIAEKAFIAAGGVVDKDVEPETLVAGVPAKIVRRFSS